MKRVVIDIETLVNCFVVCGEDADSNKRFHYVLWKTRNDMDKLLKFLDYCSVNRIVHVSFNGLNFDSQVLQWIMYHREDFVMADTDEIINAIYKKAQELISKTFNNEFVDFPEWKLQISQIDIFKQNHWDQPAKMCSLKWLQCSMDWPNIEDSPFEHHHYIENEEQLGQVISYCYNDVAATKKGFQLCKEGTELRESLSTEYGLLLNSASEPRLAKELFLYFLSRRLGQSRADLKKWSTLREEIVVGKIILPYVAFERQEFRGLLNNFKKLVITGELRGAFKYSVKYRGIQIDYGVGGLHGMSIPGKYHSSEDWIIIDGDVSSFYPNLSIQNKWAPAHIPKQAFCEQYEAFYNDRKNFKKGTAKNYLYKILLNSTFGLSIDKTSFLSDPQLGVTITVNGQLLLSMLIEMICEGLPDAKPLVANTDGVSIMIPRSQEAKYYEICKEWEKITKLTLEYENVKSIFSWDPNNFMIVYDNGKMKAKGRFEFEPHDKYDTNVLHKNKSFLVIPKGIYNYFANGIDPDKFVRSHRKIYDFCGYARAKGKWKFVKITSTSEGIIEKPIQKTLRYYMSATGSKVIKRNTEDGREIQVIAGRNHVTEFNRYEEKQWNEYDLDYNFYIKEIWKEIKLLERDQLELFE